MIRLIKKSEKINSTSIRIIKDKKPDNISQDELEKLKLQCEENYKQRILQGRFRDNSNSFFFVKVL